MAARVPYTLPTQQLHRRCSSAARTASACAGGGDRRPQARVRLVAHAVVELAVAVLAHLLQACGVVLHRCRRQRPQACAIPYRLQLRQQRAIAGLSLI